MTDVFNADETALFFRTLPNRSLVEKSKKLIGSKLFKERITVLLATSVTGEKLESLGMNNADALNT